MRSLIYFKDAMRVFTRPNAIFKRMSKRRQKKSALHSLVNRNKLPNPNESDIKQFIISSAWLAEVSGVVRNFNEFKDSLIIDR